MRDSIFGSNYVKARLSPTLRARNAPAAPLVLHGVGHLSSGDPYARLGYRLNKKPYDVVSKFEHTKFS